MFVRITADIRWTGGLEGVVQFDDFEQAPIEGTFRVAAASLGMRQ
jgi:hypothetical protein